MLPYAGIGLEQVYCPAEPGLTAQEPALVTLDGTRQSKRRELANGPAP